MSLLGLPSDDQTIRHGFSFVRSRLAFQLRDILPYYEYFYAYVWRCSDAKKNKALASLYAKGKLVSCADRKQLAREIGVSKDTIKNTIQALKRNGWAKGIWIKKKGGGRRELLQLGVRTKTDGHFAGESYFAITMIAEALESGRGKREASLSTNKILFKTKQQNKKRKEGVIQIPPTGGCLDTPSEGGSEYPLREPSISSEKKDLQQDKPVQIENTRIENAENREPTSSLLSEKEFNDRSARFARSRGLSPAPAEQTAPIVELPPPRSAAPSPAPKSAVYIPPETGGVKTTDYMDRDPKVRKKVDAEIKNAEFTIPPPNKFEDARRQRADNIDAVWGAYETDLKAANPDAIVPAITAKIRGQIDNLIAACKGVELAVKLVRIAIWDWPAVQELIRPKMTKGIKAPGIGDILFFVGDLLKYPNGVTGGSSRRTSSYIARYEDKTAPTVEGKGRTESVAEAIKRRQEARTRRIS